MGPDKKTGGTCDGGNSELVGLSYPPCELSLRKIPAPPFDAAEG